MDLKEALLAEHSKKQKLLIADYIGGNKKHFAQLMDIFFENEPCLAQRAAWVISQCATMHPELLPPYYSRLISNLQQEGLHDAVKRNTLKVFEMLEKIPEQHQGKLTDLCFRYLASSYEPIAIKVYAMTVIGKICEEEPDLKRELKLIIEEQWPHASPGFKSRAKKVLGKKGSQQ